ncbi:MAG: phosphonate ABC transporter, permease protein PhnE [Alphaproteobacteria bacterium]|nr:phosphonate ABC transporter, permease protein PhnE [Alphaproteobacteria bacterium]
MSDLAHLVSRAELIAPGAVVVPVARRVKAWFGAALFVILFSLAWIDLEITITVLAGGFGKMVDIIATMVPPSSGGQMERLLWAIAQTIAIAILGTILAVLIATPLGFAAARNIVPNAVIHFVIRRFMDIFRGIPVLVWALILVAAVGLGPIPGILAIAFADIPRLAKLLAEAIENAEERQSVSLRATGASALGVLRFGILPQTLPVYLSQCLYYLEQNFRSAAIVGVVGAGGIGFELEERIRIFAFDQVAFIILLYIIAVSLLDFGSQRLRARLT